MIVFDVPVWMILQAVAAILLPLIVGFVTTRTQDPAQKAILLAFLSVASGILVELADALMNSTEYNLGTALLTGLGSLVVSVGIHYGIWKPTRVADKVADIGVTDGRHEA